MQAPDRRQTTRQSWMTSHLRPQVLKIAGKESYLRLLRMHANEDRRLFPQNVLKQAVSVYFRHCHRQPLWLFESEQDLLDDGTEEILSIVLALALCCDSTLQSQDTMQAPDSYADTARTLIMLSITNGTVTLGTMQCLCLLAYYNYTGIGLCSHLICCS